MSASTDLQEAVAALLEAPGALPIQAPVIRRREKDVTNDLESGLAIQKGICIFVMRPFATSAMQGVPFVFFDGFEVRVRIIELPSVNGLGVDAIELIEPVAHALQWTNPGDMLAYPLALARRPTEMIEGSASAPGFEHDGKFIRIVDVIFNAVLQVNQT